MDDHREAIFDVFSGGVEIAERTPGRTNHYDRKNSKQRENMINLKLLISSEVNLKAYIDDIKSIFANSNVVANENVSSITRRDEINSQLTEVRNLLKNKHYNQRSSEQTESIQTNDNQLVDSTIRAIETPETTTTPSIEVPKPITTEEDNTKSQWPAGTTLTVGDCMLIGTEESRIGPKRKVRSFPGATIEYMYQYIQHPITNTQPI